MTGGTKHDRHSCAEITSLQVFKPSHDRQTGVQSVGGERRRSAGLPVAEEEKDVAYFRGTNGRNYHLARC